MSEGGSHEGRLQGVMGDVRQSPSAAATFRFGRRARRSQGDACGHRAVEQRVRQWKVEEGGRSGAKRAYHAPARKRKTKTTKSQ